MTGSSRSILLTLCMLVPFCPGCARRSAGPAKESHRVSWIRPTWGVAAEGLQCRLRPVRRTWPVGESPVFKLDVRNRGRRIFAYTASGPVPLDQVCIDDRWYGWPKCPARQSRVWPLAPGVDFSDLTITVPETLHSRLSRGHHIVRVALSFEGVRVESNPVAIDISPASRP